MSKAPITPKRTMTIQLAQDAYEIMEKLRGSMSQEQFLELVLRMIDSNSIRRPPEGDRPSGRE
jgi:hypothetical protein